MKLYFCTILILATFSGLSQQPKLKLEPYEFVADNGEKALSEKGHFVVKERRANENSREIELGFIRFKSTSPNPGSPIVYLAGGPGGSGSYTARGARFGLFMEMRKVGDVIAFDQRGTGISTRLPSCGEKYQLPLDQPLTPESLIAAQRGNAEKCAKFWREQGIDLNGYTTLESAHDLNDLRRALGVEKISLWGISYGTHLALAYARTYPNHVDKLLLAGLEGPDHTVKLPADTQNLLEKIDDMTRKENIQPPFLETVREVLDRLENEPVSVATLAPNGQPVTLTLGKFNIQLVASAFLSGPDHFRALPGYFKDMLEGDFSGFAPLALGNRMGRTGGMSSSMDSASWGSPQRLEKVARQAKTTLLQGAINYLPYAGLADALGIDLLDSDFRSPLHSEAESLFISGTLDGRTSVNNAVELLKGFPNGRHLIIDGAGHSNPLFLSSPKIAEIMLQFMKKGVEKDLYIKLPEMTFKTKSAIKMSADDLARYGGSYVMESGGSITISPNEDHLVVEVQDMGIFSFFPASETAFFMKAPPVEMIFTFSDSGVKSVEVLYEGVVMKAHPKN